MCNLKGRSAIVAIPTPYTSYFVFMLPLTCSLPQCGHSGDPGFHLKRSKYSIQYFCVGNASMTLTKSIRKCSYILGLHFSDRFWYNNQIGIAWKSNHFFGFNRVVSTPYFTYHYHTIFMRIKSTENPLFTRVYRTFLHLSASLKWLIPLRNNTKVG